MNLATYLSQQPRGVGQRLAQAIGAHGPDVSMWASGKKPVPVERCAQIECATAGDLHCESLRPDVAWRRIPDASWPWHPDGRPLVDPAPDLGEASSQQVAEASHG